MRAPKGRRMSQRPDDRVGMLWLCKNIMMTMTTTTTTTDAMRSSHVQGLRVDDHVEEDLEWF